MSAAADGDAEALCAEITERKAAIAARTPFSEAELERGVASLRALAGDEGAAIDWGAYRRLLVEIAHESHKDWPRTERAASTLRSIAADPADATFRRIFDRVLRDGNWDAAATAAAARPAGSKPWAVLVTGVNGIRKTSSVYQPWFKQALARALAEQHPGAAAELPDGADSFFRQLDYMVATMANEDFRRLYSLTDLPLYAALKDSIFARHRCAPTTPSTPFSPPERSCCHNARETQKLSRRKRPADTQRRSQRSTVPKRSLSPVSR